MDFFGHRGPQNGAAENLAKAMPAQKLRHQPRDTGGSAGQADGAVWFRGQGQAGRPLVGAGVGGGEALEEGQRQGIGGGEGSDREGPASFRQVVAVGAAIIISGNARLGQQGKVSVEGAAAAPAGVGQSAAAEWVRPGMGVGHERDDLEEPGELCQSV